MSQTFNLKFGFNSILGTIKWINHEFSNETHTFQIREKKSVKLELSFWWMHSNQKWRNRSSCFDVGNMIEIEMNRDEASDEKHQKSQMIYDSRTKEKNKSGALSFSVFFFV